jgi:hypothetical protein
VAIEVFILGGAAAAAGLLFARYFPRATATIVWGRIILGALAALVIALILLTTNVPTLMFVGAVLIFLMVLNYATFSDGKTSDVW